jgi:hypothetical protein
LISGTKIKKTCPVGDTQKLWYNIEKPLKKCLSTVHLREVASQQVPEPLYMD